MELSEDERRSKNDAISAHLQKLDWSDCRYLHVYRAIHRYNEPDIADFITWVKVNQPRIHVVVSRSNPLDSSMTHYIWDGETRFEINKWGILEPIGGKPVGDRLLDVVLVPMLVADGKGNRIGYGKGFYDRFLAQCRPDVRTVGISYFDTLDETIEAGYWDVPLTSIVTPGGFYSF